MLEFCKHIVMQVSFDSELFRKELSKAITWLKAEEVNLFKAWCLATFGSRYGDILKQVFEKMIHS